MARAPWYVAAGRWLKGIGAAQRKDPRTGARQIRRYGHGWETVDAPERPNRPHPKPPRRAPEMLGTSSAPIGVGHAIGVGQRIGTATGTAAYTSEMSSAESFMPIGLGAAIRGGSRSGKTSGS